MIPEIVASKGVSGSRHLRRNDSWWSLPLGGGKSQIVAVCPLPLSEDTENFKVCPLHYMWPKKLHNKVRLYVLVLNYHLVEIIHSDHIALATRSSHKGNKWKMRNLMFDQSWSQTLNGLASLPQLSNCLCLQVFCGWLFWSKDIFIHVEGDL